MIPPSAPPSPAIRPDRSGPLPGVEVRTQAAVLARDPYVRAYVVGLGAAALAFVSPLLTDAHRASLDNYWLLPLFLVPPAAGCWVGLRRLADPDERRAWTLLGSALALWLAGLLWLGVRPAAGWPEAWDTVSDALFLLYYVPALLAVGQRPQYAALAPRREGVHWVRLLGVGTLVVGWAVYAVVLPALHPDSPDWSAFWYASAVLDVLVLARLVGRFRSPSNTSPRWRAIQFWLVVAFSALLVFDVIDGALAVGQVSWSMGSPIVFLWALPSFAFVLAIRMRFLAPEPPGEPERLTSPAFGGRVPRHGGLLVLAAFSFPIAHVALEATGAVPPPVQAEQRVVVVVCMVLLGVLAAVRYRQVEAERAALDRRLRALQSVLLETQKMEAVGRMAGGIAHDFNNLLTAIGGYCDIVLDGLSPADATARTMTHVREAVNEAAALTGQLLAFSRRQILNIEPIDANDAIRRLLNTHRNLLGRHVTVAFEPDVRARLVLADAAQLNQVLLNLVVNARDAMPDGGTLTITTANTELLAEHVAGWPEAQPGAFVRIAVRDTGSGIPPDVLPRIFEPFFTTKSSGQGSGLGLATVYGIVRQSGGRLAVTTALGQGTTFVVDLPASSEAARAPGPGEPCAAGGGDETILVVEDEPAVRGLVRAMLDMGGYRVLLAGSGEEALAEAAQHQGRIHLLLTDIVMPGMNGRELAARLRRLRPDTRVLFMTGYTNDAILQHGVLDGVFMLLPKPFTRHQLLEAVRDALLRPLPSEPRDAPAGATGPRAGEGDRR